LRCLAIAALALLLVVATVAGDSPATAADPAFKVIVPARMNGTQVPREVLASIFLKEAKRWGDGRRVAAVDQSFRSPVRVAFSEFVLNKSIDGVQLLWNRKVAKGEIPPAVKSSDEDVVAYVAETEGAIGYVSLAAPLPPTVKTLTIVD